MSATHLGSDVEGDTNIQNLVKSLRIIEQENKFVGGGVAEKAVAQKSV